MRVNVPPFSMPPTLNGAEKAVLRTIALWRTSMVPPLPMPPTLPPEKSAIVVKEEWQDDY
jgi:hypothetical protein